jgi:hypothetical protein
MQKSGRQIGKNPGNASVILVVLMVFSRTSATGVSRIEVHSRDDVLGGRPYGLAGA